MLVPLSQDNIVLREGGTVLSFLLPRLRFMIADEVHQAVAKATGEDVRTIAWLGFVLLEPMPTSDDSDAVSGQPVPADDIDWDDVDLERYLAMCG